MNEDVARTDIPSSVLESPHFKEALFRVQDGTQVSISADDLRDALKSAPTRRNGTIVGPFNIDVGNGTIFGKGVPLIKKAHGESEPDFLLLSQLERDLVDDGVFNVTSIEDARSTALRAVIQRRGQTAFRSKILEAYDYRCAITECDVEDALEAAHIIPYQGDVTNHVQNGLLLRADVHVLFDLYLISIEPRTMEILTSKKIINTRFGSELSKIRLRLPTEPNDHPSKDALQSHFLEVKRRESLI